MRASQSKRVLVVKGAECRDLVAQRAILVRPAKLESGRMTIDLGPTDIAEIAQCIADELNSACRLHPLIETLSRAE